MKSRKSLIETGTIEIDADLASVFNGPWFSRAQFIHLRNNFHRLKPGAYHSADGTGCIFGILTELLPKPQRIVSRETLTKFFTGSSGSIAAELPVYQPARWLVRSFDQQPCERYHGVLLDRDTLWDALERAILARAEKMPEGEHRITDGKPMAVSNR